MALVALPQAGPGPWDRQQASQQALAQALAGYAALHEQNAQEQALAEVLGGTPGQPPKALNPGAMGTQNALVAALSGQPEVQGPPTAPTPGLMPGVSPEQAASYARSGLGLPLAASLLEQQYSRPDPMEQARLDLQREGLGLEREGLGLRRDQFASEQEYNRAKLALDQQELARPDLSSSEELLRAAGIQPGTPEAREFLQTRGSTTINNLPQSAVLPQAQAPRQIGALAEIAPALIDPASGEVDRATLAAFNVPGYGGPVPGTRGAQLRSAYDETINTLIYLQTGKAATDEERAAANAIYLPSPMDSAAEVADKMGRLQSSLTSFLEVSARGQPGATQPPAVPPIPQPAAGPGPVDQIIQQGLEFLTGPPQQQAPAGAGLPRLDQLQAMAPPQVDALVGGLTDEQLRQLPPEVLAEIERKLGGGR